MAWSGNIKSVPSAGSAFVLEMGFDLVPAELFRCSADYRIWMVIAYLREIKTSGHIGSEKVTSGLVKDWLQHPWIGCAKGFPNSTNRVQW